MSEDVAEGTFDTNSGLQFRVALGNYRLFYTPGTEDYFHRKRPAALVEAMDAHEKRFVEAASKRLDEWVNKAEAEAEDEGAEEAAAVAAEGAAADAPAAAVAIAVDAE